MTADPWRKTAEPCRFGFIEHDGDQYCFAHAGFRSHVAGGLCDQARSELGLP